MSDLIKRLNQEKEEGSSSSPVQDVVREASQFKLLVSELREACEKNPEHPLAKIKLKSVKDFSPSVTISCERVDIEALLTDKDVQEEVKIVKGAKIIRKKLVPFGTANTLFPKKLEEDTEEVTPTKKKVVKKKSN